MIDAARESDIQVAFGCFVAAPSGDSWEILRSLILGRSRAQVERMESAMGLRRASVTYREMLSDPRWQRKRLEVLQRSDFKCEHCGAADKTLHVHHKAYKRGRLPWEYGTKELLALCQDCHQAEHGI